MRSQRLVLIALAGRKSLQFLALILGFGCVGAPVVTLSGGRTSFVDGDLRAEQGDGHYVERPPFSPVHVANSTWKQTVAPKAVSREDVTP